MKTKRFLTAIISLAVFTAFIFTSCEKNNDVNVSDEDIEIAEYTIHYFSCTQEVTAKIRGSKLPSDVCNELRRCGERIEIDFLYIKGYNRKTGNPVKFDSFTLVPTI